MRSFSHRTMFTFFSLQNSQFPDLHELSQYFPIVTWKGLYPISSTDCSILKTLVHSHNLINLIIIFFFISNHISLSFFRIKLYLKVKQIFKIYIYLEVETYFSFLLQLKFFKTKLEALWALWASWCGSHTKFPTTKASVR